MQTHKYRCGLTLITYLPGDSADVNLVRWHVELLGEKLLEFIKRNLI
jgi:hypothetical protein